MNLDVLDPALFAPQSQHGLPDPLNAYEVPLPSRYHDDLPRDSSHAGGIIFAPLPLHNTSCDHFANISYDFPHNSQPAPYLAYQAVDPYTTFRPHENDLRQTNGFDLSSQALPRTFGPTRPAASSQYESFIAPAPSTRQVHTQQSQRPRPDHATIGQKLGNGKVPNDFPKFHCGEEGCKFHRTDGTSLNGKYAMAKHYKKAHPYLQYDPGRLVSSQTGRRSYRMLPRSLTHHEEAVYNPELTKHTRPAPSQYIDIDPTGSSATASSPAQCDHSQNVDIIARSFGSDQLTQARLPSSLENPFTNVPDLHISQEELRKGIFRLRDTCDFEVHKVRRLLLSHCRFTGQSGTQFLTMRRRLFDKWKQRVRDHIAHTGGLLEARFSERESSSDFMTEVAEMLYTTILRSYLPQDRSVPDGIVLSGNESKRRKLCCQLQTMKVCLQICREMSLSCAAMCHSFRARLREEASLRGAD